MVCVPIRTVLQKCPCANQWLINGDSHKLLLDSQGVTVKEGWWRPLTAARIASQQGQWIIDRYFYPFICTLSKKRFWGDVIKQYKIKKEKSEGFGYGDGKSSNIDLKTWIFLSLLGASSASSLGQSPGSWKPWLINAYGKYQDILHFQLRKGTWVSVKLDTHHLFDYPPHTIRILRRQYWQPVSSSGPLTERILLLPIRPSI